MRKSHWISLSIFLILLNIFLVHKILSTHNYSFSLKELDKEYDFNKSSLTLIIYLSSKSCGTCMEENFFWQKILKELDKSKVRIFGIVASPQERKAIKELMTIDFPIMVDKNQFLAKKISLKFLPYKIMVRRNGEVIYMAPTSSKRMSHENFYHDVFEFLIKVETSEYFSMNRTS